MSETPEKSTEKSNADQIREIVRDAKESDKVPGQPLKAAKGSLKRMKKKIKKAFKGR